VEQIRDKAI